MSLQGDESIHTDLKYLVPDSVPKRKSAIQRQSSEFGESACGEPLLPQHLMLDFTPTEEDTDFVQKKCCAFWDFVTSCPELENFMVLPESRYSEPKSSRTSDIELSPIKSYEPQQKPAKSAVSMIEFVEEKGLITRAFESKLPQSRCSLGLQDYAEEEPTSHDNEKREVCNCKKTCKSCTVKLAEQHRAAPGVVRTMCREMRDWDTEHPKSMEPPGHPPDLD